MAHILLGITGSIAAFKACHLASDWSKQGHEVRVVMTAAAQEFVTPLTFSSLTHTPTRTSMFTAGLGSSDVADVPTRPLQIGHIADAKWADILVIAPASADIIAKIACGIADDQLTSTVLAYAEGPKILCPAMNVHMYANAVTQRNIATCKELGWTVVEPESGMLACGDAGKGRMEEPAGIEEAVDGLLLANRPDADLPLKGLNVLVTAGPTQEPLDPVRFLTNHSTGKMGYALAETARDLGAHVTLVSGPVALEKPYGVDTVAVTTAQDMFDAVRSRFDNADITVMAAAVGDFRPVEQARDKIKKNGRSSIELELTSNPDILAWAGEHKRPDQTLCGFAMETRDLEANAAKKLNGKHCDMLVANNLRTPGAGFAADTNVVTVLTPGETADRPSIERWSKMGKDALAKRILVKLAAMRADGERR
ncbi:bifunctional phosphopantothenoylcysteine decarboxylase/phosphopantothenate--cysteine ligase CoaBC [Bifidobacterium ruminantium]|uniref:bifunctional phosphopantothenoylcysteine decarboxylase/phosphopantothenate--cysteine ligase CoaBC n=1 Tax=Bifidobacterium ruminantium TaxID=78346 RepID=UPI001C22900E|nr:bifunctional phosphopantothenoylcysteine decarboxylase/phosphopantothenate--cysteine ligase CoaBC [Bifidobacterium ruminantium]MBU9112027.1 bifunctional phosphopantothenoylcysteine decarboxylase/phosphopantothenate--cysteine ligase CoaBC [Bifidobacterium ruminantium]